MAHLAESQLLLRFGWRQEPKNKHPDCSRVVLTGGTRESIRAFKSIRSVDSHIPVLSRSRSGNSYAPFPLPPAECVLQVSSNVAAQLSVAEIQQFDRDSHPICNSTEDRLPYRECLCWSCSLNGCSR